jgi:hypothetical protein
MKVHTLKIILIFNRSVTKADQVQSVTKQEQVDLI